MTSRDSSDDLARAINSITPANEMLVCVMGSGVSEKGAFMAAATDVINSSQNFAVASPTAQLYWGTHHSSGQRHALIYLPGFVEDRRMDVEVIKETSRLFELIYKKRIPLSGILYVQSIDENRKSGSASRYLETFGKVCGDLAAQNVALCTSGWERSDQALCESREREMREIVWKPLLDRGASLHRFKPSRESAWAILDAVTSKGHAPPLLLQEELVDLNQGLWQTAAGSNVAQTLRHVLQQQQEALQQLRATVRSQTDQKLLEDLSLKCKELELAICATTAELRRMKVPFGRRLLARLSCKRAKARPIRMLK